MNTNPAAATGGDVEGPAAPSVTAGHAAEQDPRAAHKAQRAAYMKEFGRRAEMARGAMKVAEAAAAIGVHRNTIWNIERGDTLPDAFDLQVMARVYGVSVQDLLGDTGPSVGSGHVAERSTQAVEIGDYIYVPHFDIQVSAGHGAFHNIEDVLAMRPFDKGFIRGELGISHNEIAMCDVAGRSGLPNLKPRDTVMINLRDRAVATEGMHVVRLDDALILKKLQRLPGKVLRVSSANDEYAPFEIAGHEESQRDFEVIGRVRWAGVKFD